MDNGTEAPAWPNFKGRGPNARSLTNRGPPTKPFQFLPREAAMLARFEIVILSVYLSVCPSDTRMLCDETKERIVEILTPHERCSICFLTPKEVGGQCLVPPEICA